MPIHDWTRAERAAFPHFHNAWLLAIARVLNRGVLPTDFYAITEVHVHGIVPDVLTLESQSAPPTRNGPDVARAVVPTRLAPPALAPVGRMVKNRRPRPTVKRLVVRDNKGRRLAAVVEVVSPANKEGRDGLRAFTTKSAELLSDGVHLMVLDLWPPMLDARGMHDAITRAYSGGQYDPPAGRPLTFASYDAGVGDEVTSYVVPVAAGEPAPNLPLFLRGGESVEVPIEPTYLDAARDIPRPILDQLEGRGDGG